MSSGPAAGPQSVRSLSGQFEYKISGASRGPQCSHREASGHQVAAAFPSRTLCSQIWARGTEMAEHRIISHSLSVPVYFSHPGSPWQMDHIDNTNVLPWRTSLRESASGNAHPRTSIKLEARSTHGSQDSQRTHRRRCLARVNCHTRPGSLRRPLETAPLREGKKKSCVDNS